MGKYENIEIFQDTEKLIKTNARLKLAVQASSEKQEIIRENDKITVPQLDIYVDNAQIIVSKKRSFQAASAYKNRKTAVHNFASATNPGGGVVQGSSAQEECLCRCSGLYFNLNTQPMWDGFYTPHRNAKNPIHNDDIIYTPDVTVFKSDTANPVLRPEKDWYTVDVITCAAPNLRERPGNSYNAGEGNMQIKISDKELLSLHEKRLRRILDVAVIKGDEVVILGAFGCGAFKNKPEVVAQAAQKVVKEYRKAFQVIEFAVYCGMRDDMNYRIFDRRMKTLM